MNLRLDHTGTHTCIREIICERKCKFENFWRRKEMTIYFLDLMSSYKNVFLCSKSKLLLFRLFRTIPNVHTTLCQYVHCRLQCVSIDLYGHEFMFYMNTSKWTECSVEKNNNWNDMYTRDSGLKGSVVECKGEIIHVVPEWWCHVDGNKPQGVHFEFYRSKTRRTAWEKMSIDDLRGMSWFLKAEGGYNSFFWKNTTMPNKEGVYAPRYWDWFCDWNCLPNQLSQKFQWIYF